MGEVFRKYSSGMFRQLKSDLSEVHLIRRACK